MQKDIGFIQLEQFNVGMSNCAHLRCWMVDFEELLCMLNMMHWWYFDVSNNAYMNIAKPIKQALNIHTVQTLKDQCIVWTRERLHSIPSTDLNKCGPRSVNTDQWGIFYLQYTYKHKCLKPDFHALSMVLQVHLWD